MKASSKEIQKSKTPLSKRILKAWQLYVILALPLIWLILFKYVPMIGLQIAFKDYSARKGIWGSTFTGLKYFKMFLKSPKFLSILWNTISVSFYQLIASFPIPIIIALAFNSCRFKKLVKVVQTVTYLPHFISTVVLVGMLMQFLNPIVGIYGQFANWFGWQTVDLLSKPEYFKSLYVWSGVWQNAGWGTIIYLASLSSVDPTLHEAAKVDGASRFKRVLYIDFPTILPIAIIMLIMDAGRIMSIGFEKAFLMQNPLNLQSSEIISTYVYKIGLTAGGNYSYSTAVGLFNSIINFILIVVVNKIAKSNSETSLW